LERVGKQLEYVIYEGVGYRGCDDFYFAVMEGNAIVCHTSLSETSRGLKLV